MKSVKRRRKQSLHIFSTTTTSIIILITIITITATDAATIHGHVEESHNDTNSSGRRYNDTDDQTFHPHASIHVASWNFEGVKEPLVITVALLIAGVCKIGYHHADFLSSIVPESCILIVFGTVIGALIHIADKELMVFPSTLSPELFFLYLLPPAILESAYSLHDRTFADNLGTILVYAVIGTILNCFIIGGLLYLVVYIGGTGTSLHLSFIEILVFCSLIVAVDPVAVLAIFQEVGVNNVLYFLVFGESLLNDAVTVVLYNMMRTFNEMEEVPPTQILLAIVSFFTISLGGLSIGIIVGVITALVTKFTSHVRVVEPLAVFGLAYFSYIAAELFHFSGIISLIGCGLVQAQYAFHNISHKSHTTVKYFSKMMSAITDVVIFIFLGLSLVRDTHVWDTGFVLWTVFLCFIVRFLVVFMLTFFVNKRGKVRQINIEEQFIMAYGGLRGAVAFSLVTMLDERSLTSKEMFETTTLVIIIFTVFVQGSTVKPLVKWLRVQNVEEETKVLGAEINDHVQDHLMAGIEVIVGHMGRNMFRETLERFDDQYLKNWLQKDPTSKDEYIMELYKELSRRQHYETCIAQSHIQPPPIMMDGATGYETDLEGSRSPSMAGSPPPAGSPRYLTSPYIPNVLYLGASMDGYSPSRRSSGGGVGHLKQRDRALSMPGSGSRNETRRSSILQVIDEEEPLKPNPTCADIKRWMVKNPETRIHQTYDKNLTREEETDLMKNLQQKEARTMKLLRHRNSVCSVSSDQDMCSVGPQQPGGRRWTYGRSSIGHHSTLSPGTSVEGDVSGVDPFRPSHGQPAKRWGRASLGTVNDQGARKKTMHRQDDLIEENVPSETMSLLPINSTPKPLGSTHDPLGSTHDPLGPTHDPLGSTHDPQCRAYHPPSSASKLNSHAPATLTTPTSVSKSHSHAPATLPSPYHPKNSASKPNSHTPAIVASVAPPTSASKLQSHLAPATSLDPLASHTSAVSALAPPKSPSSREIDRLIVELESQRKAIKGGDDTSPKASSSSDGRHFVMYPLSPLLSTAAAAAAAAAQEDAGGRKKEEDIKPEGEVGEHVIEDVEEDDDDDDDDDDNATDKDEAAKSEENVHFLKQGSSKRLARQKGMDSEDDRA